MHSYGWDESLWGGEQPSKHWLDEACPEKPVVLERMCGHKLVINSKAGMSHRKTSGPPVEEAPQHRPCKLYMDLRCLWRLSMA